MLIVSEVWSKLKNEVLKPGGLVGAAKAVALIRIWLIIPARCYYLVKLLPVSVTDCERYGFGPPIRVGK